MILGVKIGRRLTAIAGLEGELFTFRDSRYAIKRRDVQVEAFEQYVRRVLDQVRPIAVYYYAPTAPETLAGDLVRRLELQAARTGIAVRPLTRADVFGSFGLLPLRTRRELREVMTAIWPELATAVIGRQEALAEAGAAALIGELQQIWPSV